MLNIRTDFVDFGVQLQPPPDFEIDYAVATTFSLDLYALLSIPLAMYYRQNLDSEVSQDNFQLLESIQNLSKHLKIFYHEGKIGIPKATSVSLFAFIEKCVVPVIPSNVYSSFHPKVWVIRYKNPKTKEIQYRLIVMSRNLTFDKSYDISYWTDGTVGKEKRKENKELIRMMKELNSKSSFEHKHFIRDLEKVQFDLADNFDSYDFSYFPNDNWEKMIDINNVYDRRLVISPFLSEGKIDVLNKKSKEKLILFSRKNELDKLPKDFTNQIQAYYFEPEIVNHHLYEESEEGEKDEYNGGEWDNNLHAKIYLRENSKETFWDFGSANCTDAAFRTNTEFLIHLKSSVALANISNIVNELTKEYNGVKIFKKYEKTISDDVEVKEEDYRLIEYDLLKILSNNNTFQAYIEPNEKQFDIVLNIRIPKSFLKNGYQLSVRPLGVKVQMQTIQDGEDLRFEQIALHQLSSFMHWRIKVEKDVYVEMLTKVNLSGMPEYRLNSILKSIINNPDKFMALLMALLSNEPQVYNANEIEQSKLGGLTSGSDLNHFFRTPVYEDLLINLSRSPKRLMQLSHIIDKLGEIDENHIIPEDFARLWKTIKEVLPNG